MSDMNHTAGREEMREPRPRRRRRRHSRRKLALQVLGTLLLVALTTGALLACFAAVYVKTVIMPMTKLNLDNFRVGLNSVLYYVDENGVEQELRTLHGDENRVWVKFEDIPEDLINATVAIEDQRFWKHPGVDWKRTAKAVLLMFTGQDIQGGSTITQQLIKNVTTYDDTTVRRKVVEIFTALEFTKNYDKNTTLEWYLNYIYLGRNCDGVYTASYKYFGKHLSQLTVAECASLISITNNPSLYDPYTNPENNARRKNLVLRAMYEQEYLTKDEYEQAKAQELVFTSRAVEYQDEENPDIYSWYEEQVITDVTNDLVQKLGVEPKIAYSMVLSGGLSIYTCVDPDIQAIVNDVYENTDNFPYPSGGGQQLQSAITIIDNETGDVVAMAGQVGEKTGNRWRNNATAAARQPGSSLKPLSVYAPALEMGLVTPISIIDDYPYELTAEGTPYPVNSGNAKYAGLTTVYQGLTHSTNTIAFRMLADLVTPAASFKFVEDKFKIDLVEGREINGKFTSDLDRAPLAMGGLTDGVNTRDMAEAFAVFPNRGVYTPSRTYTKVVNAEGNVILENETAGEVVLKDTTAYYMNTMLQNVVRSGTGYEARFDGMHIAGKTGSSTSDHDRWFAGYTPYYTAVVWTGYGQPERVRSSGRNPASIAFNKVMSRVHKNLADKGFFTINNLVTTDYCLDSGLLPTDACRTDPRGSRVGTMTLLRDDAPTGYCTRHSAAATVTVCRDCPVTNEDGTATGLYRLAGEYCPEESRMIVNALDYVRQTVGSAVAADELYTLTHAQAQGVCTVHATPPMVEPEFPELIDPDDPNWPGGFVDPDQPVVPEVPEDPGAQETPELPLPEDEPFIPA